MIVVTEPDIYTLDEEKEIISALLVDDDPEDSFIFERLLRNSSQLSFRLESCRTAERAEKLLEDRTYDLVFVDYWLGFDTSIAFLVAAARRARSPLVLITGLDSSDIRRCAFRAGAVGFLAKDALSVHAIESVTLTVLRQSGALA